MSMVEKLLVVQSRDCKLRDIDRELRDIPLRKQHEKQRLEEHTKAHAEAEERLKGLQAEIKELELESEARRDKIAKLRQQQMQLKTNKEFKAMELEIKAVEDEISEIEDRELGLMERVENARREQAERKQDLSEEESAVKQDLVVLDERAAQLAAEMEGIKAERETLAREVDPEWLASYTRIFERRNLALVPIEGGVCGGCHMKLPPYALHDARKQAEMVLCTYCGRLLYCS
jgi:predicted  nucleic acid-binding Zn-ribbon protein